MREKALILGLAGEGLQQAGFTVCVGTVTRSLCCVSRESRCGPAGGSQTPEQLDLV